MNDLKLAEKQQAFGTLPIIQSILTRLSSELPPQLVYHSHSHTLDVLHECLLFGLEDGLPERDLELLAISAAYHDSGFLKKSYRNESIGAEFARAAMEQEGSYSKPEIELVKQMILDTKIRKSKAGPQTRPSTALSGYLLDADLSNFGRDDFFDKSLLIREETKDKNEAHFYSTLLNFLGAHRWRTPAAQKLRQAQKNKNLEKLQLIVQGLEKK